MSLYIAMQHISNFRNYFYVIKNKFYSYFYIIRFMFLDIQSESFKADHLSISTVVGDRNNLSD